METALKSAELQSAESAVAKMIEDGKHVLYSYWGTLINACTPHFFTELQSAESAVAKMLEDGKHVLYAY